MVHGVSGHCERKRCGAKTKGEWSDDAFVFAVAPSMFGLFSFIKLISGASTALAGYHRA